MAQPRWTYTRLTLISHAILPEGLPPNLHTDIKAGNTPPWTLLSGRGINQNSALDFVGRCSGDVRITVTFPYHTDNPSRLVGIVLLGQRFGAEEVIDHQQRTIAQGTTFIHWTLEGHWEDSSNLRISSNESSRAHPYGPGEISLVGRLL